jgi:hypothetical protein
MDLKEKLSSFSTFEELKSGLLEYFIYVKEWEYSPNLYLLTYDKAKSDFTIPFVRQCRGTIVEKKTNKIVCYTFDKGLEFSFDDYDLSDENLKLKDVNWDNSRVERSVDGTQIRLFYYNDKWNFATTRCVDAYRAFWSSSSSFGQQFTEAAEAIGLDYERLDKSCCYSFVLCHPMNRIVKKYESPSLVHVLTRNMDTFEEVLDDDIGVPHPEYFDGETPHSLLNRAYNDTTLEEGYIVFDRDSGLRMKIITRVYESVKLLLGNGNNMFYRFLELRQSQLLNDFYNFYPEWKAQFAQYELNIFNMIKDIHRHYMNRFIYKTGDAPWYYRPHLYKLHGIFLSSHNKTTLNTILHYVNEMHPSQLCFLYNRAFSIVQ